MDASSASLLTSRLGGAGFWPCTRAEATWLNTCRETATRWMRSILFDLGGTFPSSMAWLTSCMKSSLRFFNRLRPSSLNL